jgi:hypothetical protein
MSSMAPRIPVGGPSGGMSSTIGPPVRSRALALPAEARAFFQQVASLHPVWRPRTRVEWLRCLQSNAANPERHCRPPELSARQDNLCRSPLAGDVSSAIPRDFGQWDLGYAGGPSGTGRRPDEWGTRMTIGPVQLGPCRSSLSQPGFHGKIIPERDASRRQSSSPARPALQSPGHRQPRASWAAAAATSRRPSRTTGGCRCATPSPAPEASDQRQLHQPARPCAIGVLPAACLPGPVLVASGGMMWMRQVGR